MRDRGRGNVSIWNFRLVEVVWVISNFAMAWLQGLYRYDPATYFHSVRTSKYFVDFARYIGVRRSEAKYLRLSALLHDIGKLAVPRSILQKNGVLSQKEYREIQKHPEIAFAWLTLLGDPSSLAEIPHLHHERWDGSGYPLGLKGTAIPREVRLFSVIDVWDAMRNVRPYREAIPEDKVLEYLRNSSESQFDTEVVDAFLRWRRRSVPVPIAAMPRVLVDQPVAFSLVNKL